MRRQALRFGFSPEKTLLWTEANLDPAFHNRMKSFLIKGSRGFGYWCWKPQVVLQALSQMPPNDILLYADVGCHLNPNGMPRFLQYFNALHDSDFVVFQSKPHPVESRPQQECQWTKGDVLDFFHVRENRKILESGQIAGGVFLVRNTQPVVRFFQDFRTCCMENFHLVDDSPSHSPNCPEFREHRHDQSLFSIMCKLAGHDDHSFPVDDFSPTAPNASELPILAKRDIAYGWRALIPRPIKSVLIQCLAACNMLPTWKPVTTNEKCG